MTCKQGKCSRVCCIQVCEARELSVQADLMQSEVLLCFDSDHRPEGLPLLLHQVRTLFNCCFKYIKLH